MLQAQDITLPVGAISGAIDVSPMGAATYTIPIEVVPGTQGIQPNLSIVYNSFSGMGLLGMKWSIAGLSAITRCGKIPYYDGEISAIRFGISGWEFTLDGDRLIQLQIINNNGIQREFATEIENFSRIYSHGSTTPRNTPSYFTAYKHKYFQVNNAITSCPFKKAFFSTVNSVSVSNGIGNDLNTWLYQYDNPISSPNKRIFLGFTNFACINNQNNKTDAFVFTRNNLKEIILPYSQMSYCGNEKIEDRLYNISIQNLPNSRFILNSHIIVFDILSQAATQNYNFLNNDGRLIQSITGVYEHNTAGGNYALLPSTRLHSQTNTCTYQTITLNGNQKKTVSTQVLTTQQYGTSGLEIADTVTCEYNSAGNLTLMRKGNTDGSITTTYENYTATGLYGKKTVAAQGCTPRTETYQYDATQRFVTKITNPIGHAATFTYNFSTGNKLSETDANGLKTDYLYDTFGNLKQITCPDGTQTKDSIYWFTGNNLPNAHYCTTTTSTAKPDITVYYDLLGRELCRLDDGKHYDTRYNAKGQVTKTSYPYKGFPKPDTDKIWTEYTYDDFGRTHTVTAPYTQLTYTYNNRIVTVTDNLRNVSSWKNYDAMGRIIQAKDTGGYITYSYSVTPEKRHKTEISTNGATTTILSDLWGNRLSITEPNAGTVTSTYNRFNELLTQTDARGNITSYEYDKLGRVTQKQFATPKDAPVTYTCYYDEFTPNNRGKGKLYMIRENQTSAESFTYDSLGRMAKHIKSDCGGFQYTYNQNGQLHKLMYPSGFEIAYSYTPTGKLNTIRRTSDNSLIYEAHTRNEFGATTLCSYGNDLATVYTYNPHGLLTRIHTGNKILCSINDDPIFELPTTGKGVPNFCNADSTILNYRYTYNTKGLMSARSERVINYAENFFYDNLDRLTAVTTGKIGQQGTTQTFSYHDNGNILSSSQTGTYTYPNSNARKPHAVAQIAPMPESAISENLCMVIYNSFNQPRVIEEGEYRIGLFYGANQQRTKAIRYKNDTIQNTRFYHNKYAEHEIDYTIDSVRVVRFYRYIYGDNGIVAVNVVTHTGSDTTEFEIGEDPAYFDKSVVITDSMYYIHTDHLGSYCAITNESKQVVQRNWFDPWGNVINGDTVSGDPFIDFPITERGFTGHEHYPEFKIINMNGRLYDPVIGRFFSPDNYVQTLSSTQDFNRYTYARNNPLKYKDPMGQWYEDSYWDDERDEDDGDPCKGCRPKNPYEHKETDIHGNPIDETAKKLEEREEEDRKNGDYYNGPDPFDNDGHNPPGDPPNPPNRRGAGLTISLGTTIWTQNTNGISNGFSNAFGGLGMGMTQMGGTFRFTNGSYNGNQISIKHYASNWQGGSRAGITTFSMAKWGRGIGYGAIFVSGVLGVVDITQGFKADGNIFGNNSRIAIGRTVGGMTGGIIGAEVGAFFGMWFFGVGAIPGAVIGGVIGGFSGVWIGTQAGEELNLYNP